MKQRAVKDRTGSVFEYLTVMERVPSKGQGSRWRCRCVCGAYTDVNWRELSVGDTKSCGCQTRQMISKANRKHGLSTTSVYKVWRAMHDRCYNANTKSYASHGARGIRVCKRWGSFSAFYKDMGDRPKGMTLERKDNNRGYSPSNCVWATREAQQNNRRGNRKLRYKNRTQTIAQWARELGCPPLRLWQRLNRGWTVAKTLTTPSLRGQCVRLYSDAM